MGVDRRQELGQAGRRGHDVDVVIALEQREDAGSEEVAVFGQDETDGLHERSLITDRGWSR